MSRIVVINAGHGEHDSGAVGNGLKEKDVTLNIAKRIRTTLKGYDVKVVMTRTTDKYHSLSEIASITNRNHADLFVSVHINSGGGTGFESYIYNGNVQCKTHDFQNNIHGNIMNQLNVRDRGKKHANFAVLRNTKIPAILTENLFIDTKSDANKLKSSKELDNIAQGHANGILETFGLIKQSNKKPAPTPSKPKPSKSKDDGVVWVGTNDKGKRVESIYKGSEGLNFYDSPRWNNPSGTFGYGEGWKIDNLYRVNGHIMYRVQNSKGDLYYITASKKYIKVVGDKSSKQTSKSKITTFKVGAKVKIKSSAGKYSRSNVSIPTSRKNKSYTIQQVGKDDVLLKEIYSWVKKSDVQ